MCRLPVMLTPADQQDDPLAQSRLPCCVLRGRVRRRLQLPVIYTCEAGAWKEGQTHFDTKHMPTIIWDPADLKKVEMH